MVSITIGGVNFYWFLLVKSPRWDSTGETFALHRLFSKTGKVITGQDDGNFFGGEAGLLQIGSFVSFLHHNSSFLSLQSCRLRRRSAS